MKQLLKEGTIELLIPESKKGGYSKEVYLLTYGHENYVLRKCQNKKTADSYEEIYHFFEKYGFFPKLLWRNKTQLIFEYIPGRDCKGSDALWVAKDVGEITGAINSEQIPVKQYDFDKVFFKILNFLERKFVLGPYKVKEIKSKYYELKKKANPKLALDPYDIAGGNFRLYNRKLYFVDINGIKTNLKGSGIAKAMLKWFITPRQREFFFKGYNKFCDSSFFTPAYRDFLYLYLIIKNLHGRYKKNNLRFLKFVRLNKLLSGERL